MMQTELIMVVGTVVDQTILVRRRADRVEDPHLAVVGVVVAVVKTHQTLSMLSHLLLVVLLMQPHLLRLALVE
jgi:hypothetical protein